MIMNLKVLLATGVMMTFGAMMTGCTSDNLGTNEPEIVDKDTKFYVNVKIASPAENSTRANDNTSPEDYTNGTEEERAINKITFIFYNTELHYVGYSTLDFPNDNTISSTTVPDYTTENTTGSGSIETILDVVVPVNVAAGSTKPTYVMAYVNPTSESTDQQRDLASTLGLLRSLEQMESNDKHPGFTMSNSVYYDEDKQNQQALIAAKIADGQIFESEEAARGAEDNNKVVIYVERVVAKVNLDYSKDESGNDITPGQSDNKIVDEKGNEYTLNFNVLGWGLSNLERNTFLVKNFRTGSLNYDNTASAPIVNMRYSQAKDAFSTLTYPSWNFQSGDEADGAKWGISGHRTFWAYSPTYFTGAYYPSYADEIYSPTPRESTVGETTEGATGEVRENTDKESALIYRTFNHIYDTKNSKAGEYGKAIGQGMYALEHTMEASVVTNNSKKAVTCALVVGQYKLTKEGDTEGTLGTFYISNKYVPESATAGAKLVLKPVIYPTDVIMKQAFLKENHTILIENPDYDENNANPGSKYIEVPEAAAEGAASEYLADFKIVHPSINITGNYIPNRNVTLVLDKETYKTHGKKYYYIDSNGQPTEITDENIREVNKNLYENLAGVLGGVEMYNNGYAYFAVPIKHLWGRGTTDNPVKEIGDKDFVAQLGQYGIVRNHIYNIKVTGIKGIGTGIGDPDAPIIPNVESDKYFVRTEMRVQRWRVVPSQDVVLKP